MLAASFGGHFYQVVSTPVDRASALAASAASTYNGIKGHLVTIESAAENAFVTGLIKMAWIGIDDASTEGRFVYSAGPSTGSAVAYSAWGAGEPNDSGSNEDCAHVRDALALPNNWNDINCAASLAYVIEYECPAGYTATSSGCQGQCRVCRSINTHLTTSSTSRLS